jgi:hypothetical protein
MRNDKTQSPVRRDVMAEPGQPGARANGGSEDGSRIHSSGPAADYTDLNPPILSGREPETPYATGIIQAQHRAMEGPMYGDVGHNRSMDDVDRRENPSITVLDARFVGQPGESDTPRVVSNHPNQALTGRSSLKPGAAP